MYIFNEENKKDVLVYKADISFIYLYLICTNF